MVFSRYLVRFALREATLCFAQEIIWIIISCFGLGKNNVYTRVHLSEQLRRSVNLKTIQIGGRIKKLKVFQKYLT